MLSNQHKCNWPPQQATSIKRKLRLQHHWNTLFKIKLFLPELPWRKHTLSGNRQSYRINRIHHHKRSAIPSNYMDKVQSGRISSAGTNHTRVEYGDWECNLCYPIYYPLQSGSDRQGVHKADKAKYRLALFLYRMGWPIFCLGRKGAQADNSNGKKLLGRV